MLQNPVKNAKISVITTVYNGEKFLAQTIESILNQSYKNFEYIIIDDASKDSSVEIIKKFKQKDPRIKFFKNPKNQGITKSLNSALKKAKGEYIAVIDHDDVAQKERLQTEADFLNQNPDIFLVGTWSKYINQNGEVKSYFKPKLDHKTLKKKLLTLNPIFHPSIMFRNQGDLFYREKIFFCHDLDFCQRLVTDGKKLANIPQFLTNYRIYDKQTSMKNLIHQKLFAQKSNEFYKQRLKNKKDNYAEFDPSEIFKLNTDNLDSEFILRNHISLNFRQNKFQKTRKLCRKHFKQFGFSSRILIFYLTSFLPKKLIRFLRKKAGYLIKLKLQG
ncbi:MAG: glycosyltransferase [Candidatus Moranbacteria bacterium]|nr:glycosyltransferase [Candidatus Moranbacteria bacterium]